MRFSIYEVKSHISKRGENLEKSPIGSKLKYKRKELQLTLEEGSVDICSVSYLSKVENNLIKPTKQYVKQLKDRYKMDEEEETENHYEEDLDKMIKALFLEETYKEEEPTAHYEDYQTFLLRFGYLVLVKKYQQAEHLFYDLSLFMTNLPTRSLNFALAVTNILLYKQLRYSDAKEVLRLMTVEKDDEIMKLIQEKWLLRNALKLRQFLYYEKIYSSYKEHLIKQQYFDEIPLIELERQSMYQKLSKMDHQELIKQPDTCKNILIKGLFDNHAYDKVISLTEFDHDDDFSLKYYLQSLERTHNLNKLQQVLSKLSLNDHYEKSAEIIIRHLKYKHQGSKEEQLDYLRTEILGFKHLTDEIPVLYYLMMDGFNLFKTHHFYKEATEVINKYLPMIRQLNQN